MISKELLGAVLGIVVTEIEALGGGRVLYTSYDQPRVQDWRDINPHELAHECKTWAVQKGYTLVEAPLMLRITKLCTEQNTIWEYTLEEQIKEEYFKPEYTFKACQYIFERARNAVQEN